MNGYSEFRSYSPLVDCDVVRVSAFDRNGGEYFVLIHDTNGARAFREGRQRALEMIGDAIRSGCDPGEVRSA